MVIRRWVLAVMAVTGFFGSNAQPEASQPDCQVARKQMMPPPYPNRENRRSDTIDILKYNIHLEIGNSITNLLSGHTVVRFVPRMNNTAYIRLDLLKMTVDSVKEGNSLLTHTYNDTVIRVSFAAPKGVTDTTELFVYYHGVPQMDQTGWGGFYFDNTQSAEYAYNLGVGFGANPHNYGRVWFPCFDNFIERSKYEFNITSDSARRAYCNGALVSDQVNGAKRTRQWVLKEEIPTYLANVSLAKYTQLNWSVNTLTGPKPMIIALHASDSNAVKTGFANLGNCVQGFENYFGPYRWNRVGYVLVPFGSGAMEHATNITYPRTAASSQAFEDLMAHELAHHWWGNLITCETPEDMWINEGWATFSAYMFFEWQYGKASYLDHVKTTHETLLHFLHRKEGGFLPVSGLSHQLTYSDHVYKKGADIAHTLRGYLGDSAFFAACKHALTQKQYKSLTSEDFRQLLEAGSGKSLTSFFNDWVYKGGWSHFAIDSVNYTQNGTDVVAVFTIRQKTYGAPALHSNVPLEISFFKGDWSRVVRQVIMNGASNTFTVSIPFTPVYHALNYDSKIGDASSHEYKSIKSTGISFFTLGKATLNVSSKGTDSSLVRIVHNYVRPDAFKNNTAGHRLSDQHYWRLEGIFSPGFSASLRLNYDGNKSLTGANAYLDTALTAVNGDSLALFYRKDAREDWQWLRQAKKTISSPKTGYFDLEPAIAGEYAFGNLGDTSVYAGVVPLKTSSAVKLFPNPATRTLKVQYNEKSDRSVSALFYAHDGKLVLSRRLPPGGELDISMLSPGTYTVQVNDQSGTLHAQKLIVEQR